MRNPIRRFVEAGVPGYHIEDQRPGTKKCGHQGGKMVNDLGPGLGNLPLDDRATIANMAPEYGTAATAASSWSRQPVSGLDRQAMVLIGGTEYTGEIKKSIFSVMNYYLPKQIWTMQEFGLWVAYGFYEEYGGAPTAGVVVQSPDLRDGAAHRALAQRQVPGEGTRGGHEHQKFTLLERTKGTPRVRKCSSWTATPAPIPATARNILVREKDPEALTSSKPSFTVLKGLLGRTAE